MRMAEDGVRCMPLESLRPAVEWKLIMMMMSYLINKKAEC